MAKLNVNGKVREFEAEDDTPLLCVIREHLVPQGQSDTFANLSGLA